MPCSLFADRSAAGQLLAKHSGPSSASGTNVASSYTSRRPSGTVLLVGGYDGASDLSSAELYDPAANTFSSAASMTTPRAFVTAALVLWQVRPAQTGQGDFCDQHCTEQGRSILTDFSFGQVH